MPELSAFWFGMLTASHVIFTCCIVLVALLLVFAVFAVVSGVNQISVCPTVASPVGRFSSWFLFVIFQFFQSVIQDLEHLIEFGLGKVGLRAITRTVSGSRCNC